MADHMEWFKFTTAPAQYDHLLHEHQLNSRIIFMSEARALEEHERAHRGQESDALPAAMPRA